ncbi:MAG: hypothetical protein RL235_10 [Chlamydiota bacterium]
MSKNQLLSLCSIALSINAFAIDHQEEESCPNGRRHYRTAIRHIESGGIGYNNGYTTLELFLASAPSHWSVTPFIDTRGHVFDNGRWAANVGVGLRSLWKNRAYGMNAYYDYRGTSHLHANQIGIGVETLGELFDFRMNGYLPVGGKNSAPYDTTFQSFSGHSMIVSQKVQSAMKGANAEFGLHLGKVSSCDFYTAIGPYYFISNKAPTTWGGQARLYGTFKDILTLEISDSYDRTFHNKFQGQIALGFSFGPISKVKNQGRTCKTATILNDRMLQPVNRQEIIVIDKVRKRSAAINPATGLPYFFVFVDNTSSSNGTYESPYRSLAQAQNNSAPNDIIYVFPGNGTSAGMNAGITLKASQKLWGSGVIHMLQTTAGTVFIPAQSSSLPTITNTDVDTDGNAITLATNNAISGLTIASALNDAIYGTNPQSLDVSACTFRNTTTYAIEASFPGSASISLTNNLFLNNVNGVFFALNGTSTILCSGNTFTGQTSVSSVPIEISATSNAFTAQIQNNAFRSNTTGTVRVNLNTTTQANINLVNNMVSNNGTGSQSSLGSSLVIISSGTNSNCAIVLSGNTFSGNTSNSLYMHTSGAFTTLSTTASGNTMSGNGGSALVLATPANTLTLAATNNTITGCNDNGIAVISSTSSTTGNITISNNTITDIGNLSNGITVNQNFATLNLTISNNTISGCEGTGIISYAPTGINSLTMSIANNTIANCENLGSNAASGLDIEQYTNLAGSVTNNTLSGNTGVAVTIGSTLTSPTACLTLTGNSSSTDYLLTNPIGGLFKLTPCNASSVNTGTINSSGTITSVQSCPSGAACPP